MIKLGALWIKKTQNGETLSGKFGDATLVIIPSNKRTDTSPDYDIFIKESEGPKNFAPQTASAAPHFSDSGDRGGADFKITFGKKHNGKMASSLKPGELLGYVNYLENAAASKNESLRGAAAEFVKKAKEFLK